MLDTAVISEGVLLIWSGGEDKCVALEYENKGC